MELNVVLFLMGTVAIIAFVAGYLFCAYCLRMSGLEILEERERLEEYETKLARLKDKVDVKWEDTKDTREALLGVASAVLGTLVVLKRAMTEEMNKELGLDETIELMEDFIKEES